MLENWKNKKKYPSAIIRENVKIGDHVYLQGNNLLSANVQIRSSSMGYASYIGEDSKIEYAEIGKYSCIGPRVHTVIGKHPTEKFVSIHPAFFSLQKQAGFTYVQHQKFEETCEKNERGHSIIIGSDVWIGADVRLLDGIRIGNGAIIGAGTLVNKDVPDYAIFCGVPGKVLKYRFTPEQISKLQNICWWNMDEQWIAEHSPYFDNIDTFLRVLKEERNE